ncbi:MAG: M60 family metallopeptidase, partial [Proteiniphilum sp.]
IVIIMGDSKGEDISFRIHNFGNHADASFILRPGVNKVRAKNSGLGYVSYYTDNWRNVQPVKIHFASGKVNGYFDRNKHKREDWNKLIEGAVSTYFDIKGRYINLAYTTQDLREYCSNGMDLIEVYDEIVEIEHDLMGLIKYNKRPKNHMFARTVESGLFADGWGAGFSKGRPDLVNPESIKKTTMWPIAHELGHVNQIRPGLKWVGTSETTNNVYSVVVRHHYTPDNMNLERERVNDGDHHQLLGGRMNSYLNYGVVKGEPWQCQRGDNKMEDYHAGGDHFVRLCPLWQLMLYYRIANASWKKPDWYADVAEIVRNTDETGMTDGQLQLNFMRNTMDVIGEDLTGFFETAGMLKPIDRHLDDYGGGNRITITQQDCDDLKAYASKYPKPQSPVIYYLTMNSLEAYEKKLSVTGTYGAGVTIYDDNKYGGDQYGIISHNVWRSVAVFETYQGDILTKVSMVGLDSDDLNTTLVWYPPGSTRIEAVAWDGTRTLVYGER